MARENQMVTTQKTKGGKVLTWITVREAAAIIGVDPSQIIRYCSLGRLERHYENPRFCKVRLDQVEALRDDPDRKPGPKKVG